VESLVDNGQPGRLTLVEKKVCDLQRCHWKITGIYMGLSGVVGKYGDRIPMNHQDCSAIGIRCRNSGSADRLPRGPRAEGRSGPQGEQLNLLH
jgi:hypothetical protein